MKRHPGAQPHSRAQSIKYLMGNFSFRTFPDGNLLARSGSTADIKSTATMQSLLNIFAHP